MLEPDQIRTALDNKFFDFLRFSILLGLFLICFNSQISNDNEKCLFFLDDSFKLILEILRFLRPNIFNNSLLGTANISLK